MSNDQGLTTRSGSQQLSTVQELQQLAGGVIRTPLELADRVRAMSAFAHILSPAIAVSSIADQYVINTAVVVIDTTLPPVDYGSAAGSDVYYQASIHKGKNEQIAGVWSTNILEVSLNKNALIRILGAAGVDVTRSERTDDGRDPYYWSWVCEGVVVDFDGRRRRLPPGNVEIDYRDGAASIGEWSPGQWRDRVLEADKARAAARTDADKKKIKPDAINGWSEDRVRNARRFGLRIAEAEAMNRLARNLGIKQKYTLEELRKPFVLFRCSFNPDMSDPVVRQIVTAAHMGSTDALYRQPERSAGLVDLHRHTIDAESAQVADAPAAASSPAASSGPSGAVPFDDFPEDAPPPPSAPIYRLLEARKLAIDGLDWFFFTTAEGPTIATDDRAAARIMNDKRQAGITIPIETERRILQGQEYLIVIEIAAGAALPRNLKT